MLHTRYLRNIKTFSVLIFSYTKILTRMEIGEKKVVWAQHSQGRASVFTQFRVFLISIRNGITAYQYTEKVLYFLYNTTQK